MAEYTYTKNPCERCGHSPDDHRFDDYNLPEFEAVPMEDGPFRCLGPGFNGCGDACPNFKGEPLTWFVEAPLVPGSTRE